jgi:hypothetical protein
MKKLVLWLFLAILTAVGCEKNISSDEVIKLPENPHNKELVQALISGGLGTDNGTDRERCDYTVSVEHDMLKLNSTCGAKAYLDALDALHDTWDSSTDPELLGNYEEKNLAGDPVLNAVDDALGFTSLRRTIDRGFYDDNNYEANMPIQVSMPDMKILMNPKYEVAVGDSIYKLISSDIMAIVSNNNREALNKLREASQGIGILDENIRYFNLHTGNDIIQPDQSARAPCTILLVVNPTQNVGGDYRAVKLSCSAFATDGGNFQMCTFQYTVDWGDGSSETNLSGNFNHTYNFNSTGPTDCKQYTYTVTVSPNIVCGISGSCVGIFDTRTDIFNICGSSNICMEDNNKHLEKVNFQIANENYMMEGIVGVQQKRLFVRARVWGGTYLYKKTTAILNPFMPVKSKLLQLGVVIRGNWIADNCTTLKRVDGNAWRFNVTGVESYNSTDARRIGWSAVGGRRLIADHYIYRKQGSNVVQIASIIDHYLQY